MGRRKKGGANELHGVLLVDKGQDMTSFDVIRDLRPVFGQRSLGHSGTLDPMATGLLVVCAGNFTRFASWLTDDEKVYEAVVTLGAETDTDDAMGEVTRSDEVRDYTDAEIEAALEHLRGDIDQVPPAYSAIHVDGQRAYDIAREGGEVSIPARAVQVRELRVTARTATEIHLFCRVSKGTYIRSVARDLGRELGCGAHLSGLRRTRSGAFDVTESHPIDDLRPMVREEVAPLLLTGREALPNLEEYTLEPAITERLRMGQRIALESADDGALPALGDYAGVDSERGFIGVVRVEHNDEGRLILSSARLLPT